MIKMEMINGQTYIKKKSWGICVECFKSTNFWLHNANGYFCLSEKCFRDRERWLKIQSFINNIQERFEKVGKVLDGTFIND